MTTENNSDSPEQRQNDDFQMLSSLLIKERPAESSLKVKIILDSDAALPEKIRLIRSLDESVAAVKAPQPPVVQESKTEKEIPPSVRVQEKMLETKGKLQEKKEVTEDKDEDVSSESQNLQRPVKKSLSPQLKSAYVIDAVSEEAAKEVRRKYQHLSQNRKMLKPFFGSSPFFRFLFSERGKIKNFAKETGIIRLPVFGLNPLINHPVCGLLPKNILPLSKILITYLKPVLGNGWLYLEKRDYNLITLLFKLCREISLIKFDKFNWKSPNLIDKLAGVELLFLILHYDHSDLSQLIFAVDMVYNKDPSKREQQRLTSVNIRKLMERDQMRPSLYNLILGLNIVKTRTFFILEDLQKPGLLLVDNHDYNCSPKIRGNIDEHLRSLEKRIAHCLKQEKEAFRLQAYIPTNGKGIVDYTQLKHFYDSSLHSRHLSFNSNKENIIKFIINLGDSFVSTFRDILSERIEVESSGMVKIFKQTIFGQDIIRLDFNLRKLDKIQTIMPKFATPRFLSIKKTVSGAIESEAEAIGIIDEIINIVISIGKRLAHVLRNTPSGGGDKEESGEILFFSMDDRMYSIPCESQKIKEEGYLKNSTVREALLKIAGICYQTGAFVQDNELVNLLAKGMKVRDEIRSSVKHYKRIAHEKVYISLVEKYDLPL